MDGIDEQVLRAWLVERVDVRDPLTFGLVPGGRSNLTFIITDGLGRRWVLRRPPAGAAGQGAHDMGREVRILSALAGGPVPVPAVVGRCPDPSLIGAEFYVMTFVDGLVLRETGVAEALTPAQRDRVT